MRPGNRLRLLVDGAETRQAMLEAIASARRRVWLETFILIPDSVGREILGALEDAARRGLEVFVIADHSVSFLVGLGPHRALEKAGATVVFYNPLPFFGRLGKRVATILHRDHRKILITDETAFCGGHNVSKSYLDSGPGTFFDVTLQVDGPCVEDLAQVVIQTLEQATDARPASLPLPEADPDGVPAAIEMMDRKHGIETASEALQEVLDGTRERVFLMIAYFVPERWLIEKLKSCAERGVDVRVMLVGKTDMPFVRGAANNFYGELVAAGVRVFELWERKLHAKCVVADGEHVIVGTFDYNRFSARHSLEVSISALDSTIAAQLEGIFLANMEYSREIELEEWERRGPLRRLWHWASLAALNAATRST